MNDLIEKLEDRIKDVEHDIRGAEVYRCKEEANHCRELKQAIQKVVEEIKSHPAITAREKAKKVADFWGLGPGSVVYWNKTWVVDARSHTHPEMKDDSVFRIPVPNPTPEEIPYAYYPVQ